MNKKRLCLRVVSLVIIIMGGYFNLSIFAEETIQSYFPAVTKRSKEECMKNFDISTIDFSRDANVAEKRLDLDDLLPYFECKAVAEDNIGICAQLQIPILVKECQLSFNEYYATFGKLGVLGYANPQILNKFSEMSEIMEIPKSKIKTFTQAWLKGDLSFCEKSFTGRTKTNRCKATISGDPQFCRSNDKACKNEAIYMAALKGRDIKKCKRIESANFERLRLMCQVIISGDKKVCEESPGFKKFRASYCE